MPQLQPTLPPSKPTPPGVIAILLDMLRVWLALMQACNPLANRRRVRAHRPWQLRVRSLAPRQPVDMRQQDVDRLLQRHRDLKDMDKLAQVAGSFRLPESDFFADPQQVERLIRHFLDENPPWLHVGKIASGSDRSDAGGEAKQDVVMRERVTRAVEDVTLFVPSENWRDQPLASLTMRPARFLGEMSHARLLDQILPPTVLLDRMSRSEILIPNRDRVRHRLEFEAQERRLETVVVKPVEVPIEIEGAGGADGQLLYILLDASASMQGKNATLALAVIMAALRANMGRRDTRYLFRRYAEEENLWPREVEPPLQARTVREKDAFLDTILETNFSGGATHVNHALNVAVTDVENLRRDEKLETQLLLVTDGRAEILEGTILRLRGAGIKVHTVMVTPEANPGLQSISESFTALDIHADKPVLPGEQSPLVTDRAVVHAAHI